MFTYLNLKYEFLNFSFDQDPLLDCLFELRFSVFCCYSKVGGKLTLSPRHVEILDKFHFFNTFSSSAFNDDGHTFLRPGGRKTEIKIQQIQHFFAVRGHSNNT